MNLKNLTFLLALFLLSCQKSTPTTEEEEAKTQLPNFEYLVEATEIKRVPSNSLSILSGIYLSRDLTFDFNDVTGYNIVYKTQHNDETIEASGLLLIPAVNTPLPLISFQHGTMRNHHDTPSNFNLDRNEATIGAVVAGIGYIVAMPDYIGYGTTADLEHPYEVGSSLGSSALDMLRAAKEYLDHEAIQLSEKLFIGGYSEGGYASMALLQQIEQNTSLKVTHAALGAGAYNKTAFSKAIASKDMPLNFMTTYLWVLHTYNTLYSELSKPWSYYVNAPYASQLEAITDWKTHSDWEGIETNPQKLFTTTLLDDLVDENSNMIKTVLAQNDRYDWAPKTPITLFHGTEDDYVFPLNSQTAYEAISDKGGTITYITLEGHNHQTAIIPYLEQTLQLFEGLK